MRFFGYWTVLVALSISAVAAYYSIVGLVAIFAAAAIPIIIMGSVLEVGKLTSAVWLHLFWKQAPFLIKTYLTIAVVLLMFITSMGIFGFLSKAHIEQNAVAVEGQAQLERIESDIRRGEELIARAEVKIEKLDRQDENADAGLQEKIDTETARIATVYERLDAATTQIDKNLADSLVPYQATVDQADVQLSQIAQYVADNNIRALQGLIGAKQDGRYGPKTAARVEEFRSKVEGDRQTALEQIQQLRNTAREERQALREVAEQTVQQSNNLINRLRDQIGTVTDSDVELDIQEQRTIIKNTEDELDLLFERKYEIEAVARQLEAEVGPVKYIAELIYGDTADKNALEEAVRWVIIILVVVFDPLAVVLVISGITLIEKTGRTKNEKTKQTTAPKKDAKIETQDVESMGDQESGESHQAETENYQQDTQVQQPERPIIHSDEQGREYTIDASGKRNYLINEDQEKLNEQSDNEKKKRAQTRQAIDAVVVKMKEQGRWPNGTVPTERVAIREILDADNTGELETLLEKADDETRREVWNAIINDVYQNRSK